MSLGTIPVLGRARASTSDRERVAESLRRACAEQRLSFETFSARLDLVYAAKTRAELDRLLNDLPELDAIRRAILTAVAWISRLTSDLQGAWRAPRTARMVLPTRETVVIGRSPLADFVIADGTVSLRHAVLRYADGSWTLRDEGSTNGTFLNGWRVADEIVVRPGDELLLGCTRFVLTLPRP
jgi:hypothetical protein